MPEFSGRYALITGGSSGIGLATVRRLRAGGALVISGDLDAFPDSDRGVTAVRCDLATREGCEDLVTAAGVAHPCIDVLVNNVGAAPIRDGFERVTDDDWLGLWNLNLMSAIRTTRAALPLLRAARNAAIVMICSTTARMPDPCWVDYAASKAALLAVSRALAEELGHEGIRVNAVSPGSIRTPLWDRDGGFSEELARRYGTGVEEAIGRYVREERRIPLGTPGRAEDVAAAVAFLACDEAAYVTGSEMVVDGGLIKTI